MILSIFMNILWKIFGIEEVRLKKIFKNLLKKAYGYKNIQKNQLLVEDGHGKLYIVDQSKVRKIS